MSGFHMRHITNTDLTRVDIEAALDMCRRTWTCAPVNSLTPYTGFIPPVGTWRIDPVFGDFDVLTWVPLDEIQGGEPECDIKLWEGYPLYVQWAREGRQPPPIQVVRHVNGHLVRSDGRRRTLAARDAGNVTHMLAWFSETNPETSRNAWELPRTEFERMPIGAPVWMYGERHTKIAPLFGETGHCTRPSCRGEINALDANGQLDHICPFERVYTTLTQNQWSKTWTNTKK